MWKKHLIAISLSLIFYFLGSAIPSAVLLDMPFGFGFYVADKLGVWHQGIMWAVNNRLLALVCFFIWPLLVSTLLGYGVVFVARRILAERKKYSPLYVGIFFLAVFGLILSVHVRPASYYVSYYGYWTANY